MITETDFFDALDDETRRRILALIWAQTELCVCELHFALDQHQPKVSRHLSVLRDTGILTIRRQGTWIYYHLNPQIPAWCFALFAVLGGVWNANPVCQSDRLRLQAMPNRPIRCCA